MDVALTMRISHSLLFVPGDRPERFDKAQASGAHEVILDLEDAVAPAAKPAARRAVAEWLQAGGAQGRTAVVRVNAADTGWHADDLAMLQQVPGGMLMLPKAETVSLVAATSALPGRPTIALLETVRGFAALRELASVPGLGRIAFGSVDFGAETGIADEGDAMLAIRTQIVLESCLAGLQPPIDGVSVTLDDPALIHAQAARSRQLGFGGKLCIHPRQVEPVNAAFSPDETQVRWARRVLDAFEASQGAATVVDGKMVDKPVVEQARRLLGRIRSAPI